MADIEKRLETNVDGNFFVDETCINCDTCRQLASSTFQEDGDYSTVYHQPQNRQELFQAYQALLACPVGSIGAIRKDSDLFDQARESFPLRLDEEVYYTGFNSEKSFGANSYYIVHPDGNWLIDSPRYLKQLVDAFEEMGGIRYIFLSHEDDVADADRYARKFDARRIIHAADKHAMPEAEWVVQGYDVLRISPDFQIIPVPGHTAGSQALLYKEKFLFSGDHLWWDQGKGMLGMPSRLVWNSQRLLESTQRFLDYSFEWVLPGHGDRVQLSSKQMQVELKRLIGLRQGGTALVGKALN